MGFAPSIEVLTLGLADYRSVYALQKELLEKKRQEVNGQDYLLLVEHPSIYTFGRKGGTPPLDSQADVIEIERGGEATYHNPGQLVAYPILSLPEGQRDIPAYLRKLEGTIIETLASFHLPGIRKPGATGVWVEAGEKKIASLGVAVSHWVTYHGIALNVENDLSGFSKIHPCGFDASVMTSMREQLGEGGPSFSEVSQAFVECFAGAFCQGF